MLQGDSAPCFEIGLYITSTSEPVAHFTMFVVAPLEYVIVPSATVTTTIHFSAAGDTTDGN